jgi:hypothetical protein
MSIDGVDIGFGQEQAEAIQCWPHRMLSELHQPELELLLALDDKLFTPTTCTTMARSVSDVHATYTHTHSLSVSVFVSLSLLVVRLFVRPESKSARTNDIPMAFFGGGLTGLGTGSFRSCVEIHSSLSRSYNQRNSLNRLRTVA